ncbi:auxin-responsive protein IAA29 [Euphorbia lathyris]|uniref:auxin-responsive protein IAA29 n=1 Tax=Euphorbia lathyris TaxID=212925 RepID=UPI003313672F
MLHTSHSSNSNSLMEIQLDLSLGLGHSVNGFESKMVSGSNPGSSSKKRSFMEVEASSQTLPLLSWSSEDQPNDEDEYRKKKQPSCPLNMNGGVNEDEDELVGWPPIKSWRKKLLHHHQQNGHIFLNNRARARDNNHQLGNINHNHNLNHNNNDDYDNERHGGSNSMYVKVKMEGVAIARKINLRLFNSYPTLTQFLINMFPKCQHEVEEEDGRVVYTLTYQDKYGDWLLAADVPWKTFIESAQRLELQRNGG